MRAVCRLEVSDIRIRPQHTIHGADTVQHGIRMDLYVDEEGKCLYDFEPDNYTDSRTLPRRSRYYRALLDGRQLEAGKDYDGLPDLWMVFILSKDPFGKNRMCYTVKNGILEEPGLAYEDGAVSLFLYTGGDSGGNEDLARLLKYMEKSTEENAATEELKELHSYVETIKRRKEVGVRYMKSWEFEHMWRQEGREEGRKEGREEGREEGKLEALLETLLGLLGEIGSVPESLKEKISGEHNRQRISKWIKLAAKAGSFAEFEEKM